MQAFRRARRVGYTGRSVRWTGKPFGNSCTMGLCIGVLLLASMCVRAEIVGLNDASQRNPGSLMQGDIAHWSRKRINTPHALTFDDDVHGVSAARFEIRPEDAKVSEGYRAELRDPYVAAPHEEVWYRFRTLIPAPLAEGGDLSLVLAQWHDKKTEGRPAARPPLALRLQRGTLRVTLWNDAVLAAQGVDGNGKIIYESREFPIDAWIDFVFAVQWSPDRRGIARMWMNGALAAEHRGAIGYRDDVHGPYFKLGVYTVHEFDRPLYVYHSDYRRASSRAGLTE